MIAYLNGSIASKNSNSAIIEVHGIGYELAMSTKSLASLPAINKTVQVWVYMHVKDDAITLYGFNTLKEKELFQCLISVSGIGPKIALAALSSFSAEELTHAISTADLKEISKIPGVGKKSAQRIILELQGTLKTEYTQDINTTTNNEIQDAIAALESMGFSSEEISRATRDINCEQSNASAIIKASLKKLGGKS